MMRRMILFTILALSAVSGLYAALDGVDSRGFQITAQKGELQEVSITPIIAASHDSPEGIPFYLTDESVSYSAASGAVAGKRRIATWSLYCNFTHPSITIEAPHLMHSDGTEVPYQLAFYYQFPYEGSMVDGNLLVESGSVYESKNDLSCRWNDLDVPVNFSGKNVRFMIGDVDIRSGEYPYGDYRAVVRVTINGD